MTPEERVELSRLQAKDAVEKAQAFIDGFAPFRRHWLRCLIVWCVGFGVAFAVVYADWINPDRWHGVALVAWFVCLIPCWAVGLAPFLFAYGVYGTRVNRRFIVTHEKRPS